MMATLAFDEFKKCLQNFNESLNPYRTNPGRTEKITLIYFIKPFEAPFKLNFILKQLSQILGSGRVKPFRRSP